LEEEAERIISETYKEANLFLLKDPRLCVLLPFWEDIFAKLDIEIRPLLVFRNPIEVAHSLFYRNGFSITKSLLLWAKHVLYSEFYTRKYRRCFLNTADFIRNPLSIVEALESVGIKLKEGVDKHSIQNIVKSFVDENLIHYNLPPKTHFDDLPDFVRLPFVYLEKITTGELKFKEDLESKFDLWRSEYEEFARDYFVNVISHPSQKVIFQVFFDYGNGFSEENSLRIELSPKKGINFIDLALPANVKQFRIDPIGGFGCVIRILDFYIGNKSNGKRVYLEHPIESNADFVYDKEYTFLHEDPQIIVNQSIVCSDNYDHFYFSFEYLDIFSPVSNQVEDRLNGYKVRLQSDLQHKENTISELQNNLSSLEQELKKIIDYSAHLQTQLDNLTSERESLLAEISRKDEEKNSLQIALSEKEKQLSELQRELQEKNGLVSELQNNLSQLQTRLDNLTSEKESLLAEISRKDEEKNSLQIALSEKEKQLSELQRELQEKNGLVSELQNNLSSLEQELKKIIDYSAHLQTQLDNLTSEKESLLAEISRRDEEIETLSTEKGQLIIHLSNLSSQLDNLTSERENLLAEISRKDEEKNSLQIALSEKEKQLSELQREVETLSAEKGRLIFMLYNLTNRPNAFIIVAKRYYSKMKKLFRRWRR
ncbi:MAG: hypothetical protein QW228_07160, partial [Candidatus Aenigmatarchaeota archaeon]